MDRSRIFVRNASPGDGARARRDGLAFSADPVTRRAVDPDRIRRIIAIAEAKRREAIWNLVSRLGLRREAAWRTHSGCYR
jgi:hypothetical protein